MSATRLFRHRLLDPVRSSVLAALTAAVALAPIPSRADQGGISFWLPGAFGSLAAAPVTPGWAMATFYYHTSVSAGGDVASSRAVRLGNAATNLTVTLDARLKAAAATQMAAKPTIRK
jgi:hypothetical protein